MVDENSLITMPLQEAMAELCDYEIELVQTDCNFALNKPIDKSKYTTARVIRATIKGNKAVLLWDYFKEI